MSTSYFDPRAETASREELRQNQLHKLRQLLAVVLNSNPFYQRKLREAGVRAADDVQSWDDMRQLPFTTKSELAADQAAHPLFGTNLSYPLAHYVKYHQTSGTTGKPLRWLDTQESWQWWTRCWSAVYKAAGVSEEDRVFFAFGFGPFVGFWSAYDALRAVGALSIPGGSMSSEQRLHAIIENSATVLVCTPTYALHLAEVAAHSGIDIAHSQVRVTIHAGEPGASIPSTRQRIEEAWGAQCFDHTGATEVGATGFSCVARNGVHLNESEFIFEVLDPLTQQPAEEGELVVTNLGRLGSPVIRYRLGDCARLDTTTCACGRTYARMVGGIIGRADDMVTVRGVNVYPSAIEAIVRQFTAITEFRVELTQHAAMDELGLQIEVSDADGDQVARALTQQVQRQLSLRPTVTVMPAGALPRFELKARRFIDRREK
jgi:phenylacetate-CoA ligase